MKFSVRAYFLIAFLGACAVNASAPAYADKKTQKTINISREAIERARGNHVVSGDVTKVGHEVIYIESQGERIKIDLDDIAFPESIDEIIHKQDRVVATGILKDDEMTANRIVVIRDGIRRTYISRKPLDIKIKGNDDVKIRITP